MQGASFENDDEGGPKIMWGAPFENDECGPDLIVRPIQTINAFCIKIVANE